jgi:hypothetical protein
METEPSAPGVETSDPPPGAPAPSDPAIKPRRARAKRILPTDRIAFAKQLDLLRAYAAASNEGSQSVTNEDVASIIKMTSSTVSLANSFLADNGLIQRADKGHLPAREVLEFAHAHQWNPETSAHKLAPVLQDSWFGQALLPTLAYGPIDIEDAIARLAAAVHAQRTHRPQLRVLIEYLEAAGLIETEGNMVSIPNASRRGQATPPESSPAPTAPSPQPTPQPVAPVPIGGGAVQFNVAINVDMAELANWDAERITAFFTGLAQVIAAKGVDSQD